MLVARLISFSTLLLLILSGCSIYQSDARKFLEKQAFSYSGKKALTNLLGCPTERSQEWLLAERGEKAKVFTSEQREFALRVEPNGDDFACEFQFTSAQEMIERTGDAVDLTMLEWSSASESQTRAQ